MTDPPNDTAPDRYVDPYLTEPDLVVLRNLLADIEATRAIAPSQKSRTGSDSGYESLDSPPSADISSSGESQLRKRRKICFIDPVIF